VNLVTDSGSVVTKVGGWQYFTASSIDTVSPAIGQVGTRVEIAGSNLLGIADGSKIVKVLLASVEAQIVAGTSQDTIEVIVNENASGISGDVFIKADSGAYAVLKSAWTYPELGEIGTVVPAVGQLNTLVTISGARMLGAGSSAVKVWRADTLADITACIISSSDTTITVRSNVADAFAGGLKIESDTGAIVEASSGWTYGEQSVTTDVSPAVGQLNTEVTITGERFRAHGASVDTVTLAGVEASIQSEGETSIVVIAAASGAAAGTTHLVSDTGAFVATGRNGLLPSTTMHQHHPPLAM